MSDKFEPSCDLTLELIMAKIELDEDIEEMCERNDIPYVDSDLVERAKLERNVVGYGDYGVALKVEEEGEELCVKTVHRGKLRQQWLMVVNEAINIKKVQSVIGMVRLVGVSLLPQPAVVTLFAGESLKKGLERGAYSKTEYISIIGQLLYVVRYLNSHYLCHCDLKSSNVLVKRGEGRVAVTLVDLADLKDFGHFPEMDPRERSPHFAPELYQGQPLTKKSQIYQLGWLLLEIMSVCGGLDEEFLRMVKRTTSRMRRERPSLREVNAHWKRIFLKDYYETAVGKLEESDEDAGAFWGLETPTTSRGQSGKDLASGTNKKRMGSPSGTYKKRRGSPSEAKKKRKKNPTEAKKKRKRRPSEDDYEGEWDSSKDDEGGEWNSLEDDKKKQIFSEADKKRKNSFDYPKVGKRSKRSETQHEVREFLRYIDMPPMGASE